MNNFEEKIKKLEEMAEEIKNPNIALEDAIKCFEEGITLAKGMEDYLNKLESKVQILMNGEELLDNAKGDNKDGKEPSPQLDLFSTSTEINGTRNA